MNDRPEDRHIRQYEQPVIVHGGHADQKYAQWNEWGLHCCLACRDSNMERLHSATMAWRQKIAGSQIKSLRRRQHWYPQTALGDYCQSLLLNLKRKGPKEPHTIRLRVDVDTCQWAVSPSTIMPSNASHICQCLTSKRQRGRGYNGLQRPCCGSAHPVSL
jgi:hypothetical protein